MLRYNQTREPFTQLVSSLPLEIPFIVESVVCSCAGHRAYLFNGRSLALESRGY